MEKVIQVYQEQLREVGRVFVRLLSQFQNSLLFTDECTRKYRFEYLTHLVERTLMSEQQRTIQRLLAQHDTKSITSTHLSDSTCDPSQSIYPEAHLRHFASACHIPTLHPKKGTKDNHFRDLNKDHQRECAKQPFVVNSNKEINPTFNYIAQRENQTYQQTLRKKQSNKNNLQTPKLHFTATQEIEMPYNFKYFKIHC